MSSQKEPVEPKDLLLLIWVHGYGIPCSPVAQTDIFRFKGNEVTFESFPDREVYPRYLSQSLIPPFIYL